MAKGARHLFGNGCSIDIWNDPWVARLPNFKLMSKNNLEEQSYPILARDLVQEGKWNTDLLATLFS